VIAGTPVDIAADPANRMPSEGVRISHLDVAIGIPLLHVE
jgi:hypothetical protein